MARAKTASPIASPFQGRWKIVESDVWDDEALNLVEDAYIEFEGESGEMRFIAVVAHLDVRYDVRNGSPVADFSWDGFDDDEPRSGRGWVAIGTAGRLVGHIHFHLGDDSGFVCERM